MDALEAAAENLAATFTLHHDNFKPDVFLDACKPTIEPYNPLRNYNKETDDGEKPSAD